MRGFIILSSQRSGTNYLAEAIGAHPDVLCEGELFDPAPLRSRERKHFYHYCRRNPIARLLSIIVPQYMCACYLNQKIKLAYGHKVYGFRLMYSQVPGARGIIPLLETMDFRIVHLVRENFLQRLVSFNLAKKTEIWIKKQATNPKELPTVHLDTTSLLDDLTTHARTIDSFREQCANMPILEMTYEQFFTDQESESIRLTNFLGIEHCGVLQSSHQKINTRSLKESISNYQEVANVLSGTEYEHFLDSA